MKAAHHRGTYHRDAMRVRAQAWANPDTRCWKCERQIHEITHRNGRPARWTAGHVVDGQAGGMMLPECSVCACSTGAQRGNRMREPRSVDWY